jgi:hypothetical protein
MPKNINFSPITEDSDDIVTATTKLVKEVPFRLPDLILPFLVFLLLLILLAIVYRVVKLKPPKGQGTTGTSEALEEKSRNRKRE